MQNNVQTAGSLLSAKSYAHFTNSEQRQTSATGETRPTAKRKILKFSRSPSMVHSFGYVKMGFQRRKAYPFTSLICVTIILIVVFLLQGFCDSKEIEVTNEWQLVKEGDTLPAGVHVKMDMTTGEKWVKQVSPDINDEDEASQDKKDDSQRTTENEEESINVEILPDGTTREIKNSASVSSIGNTNESVHTSVMDKKSKSLAVATTSSDSSSTIEPNDESTATTTTKYDFDAMYRALSKLSPDVLGDLPSLPNKEDPNYEERLTKIWETRQQELAELHRLMELADVPKILKSYIVLLRKYYRQQYQKQNKPSRSDGDISSNARSDDDLLSLGTSHKLMLDVKVDDTENILNLPNKHDGHPVSEMKEEYLKSEEIFEPNDEDHISIDDVLFVLEELEFMVTDIDMARDFYILGGWPLLVSLLQPNPPSWLFIDEQQQQQVQMWSAWVIGNMVKNHEEFHSWALEPISNDIHTLLITKSDHEDLAPSTADKNTTTVMDTLLHLVEEYGTKGSGTISMANTTTTQSSTSPSTKSKEKLMQKVVYALTSLLRGNRMAQMSFIGANNENANETSSSGNTGGGADALGHLVTSTLDQKSSLSEDFRLKLASKVLMLSHDLLMEIHHEKEQQTTQSELLEKIGVDVKEEDRSRIQEEHGVKQKEHMEIMNAFTTETWCDGAWDLFQNALLLQQRQTPQPQLLESSLLILKTMIEPCSKHYHYGSHEKGAQIRRRRSSVVEIRDGWHNDNTASSLPDAIVEDDEWRDELIQLANDVLEEMDRTSNPGRMK